MKWKIAYSAKARQDLRNIYKYIAFNLLMPETATKQVQRIMNAIRSLDEMPLRFRLYDREPWYSQGLRFFSVNNYLVFYLPDKNQNMVNIVRIMYSGRDIDKQLNND